MTENKSRANVPSGPAPSLLKNVVGVAPAKSVSGERLAPMTFNMPKEWHTRFKTTAVIHDMSMKDLLAASFEAWEREQSQK